MSIVQDLTCKHLNHLLIMYDERKKMNELDSIRLSVFIYQKQQGIFIIKFVHYYEQCSNLNFIKISKRGKTSEQEEFIQQKSQNFHH